MERPWEDSPATVLGPRLGDRVVSAKLQVVSDRLPVVLVRHQAVSDRLLVDLVSRPQAVSASRLQGALVSLRVVLVSLRPVLVSLRVALASPRLETSPWVITSD